MIMTSYGLKGSYLLWTGSFRCGLLVAAPKRVASSRIDFGSTPGAADPGTGP
jgi:hypothetical protein